MPCGVRLSCAEPTAKPSAAGFKTPRLISESPSQMKSRRGRRNPAWLNLFCAHVPSSKPPSLSDPHEPARKFSWPECTTEQPDYDKSFNCYSRIFHQRPKARITLHTHSRAHPIPTTDPRLDSTPSPSDPTTARTLSIASSSAPKTGRALPPTSPSPQLLAIETVVPAEAAAGLLAPLPGSTGALSRRPRDAVVAGSLPSGTLFALGAGTSAEAREGGGAGGGGMLRRRFVFAVKRLCWGSLGSSCGWLESLAVLFEGLEER